jgi:hypothetical protein
MQSTYTHYSMHSIAQHTQPHTHARTHHVLAQRPLIACVSREASAPEERANALWKLRGQGTRQAAVS